VTFVGEGRLSWRDTLAGGRPLIPLALALATVIVVSVVVGASRWGVIAGAAFVLWLAMRSHLPQAVVRSLRRGRPHFRVQIDDDGVRTFDASGAVTTSLDWFEIARGVPMAQGLVLMMRMPKSGANAVLVPRAFFSASDFDAIVALARTKLPPEPTPVVTPEAQAEARRRARRTLVLWVVLVVLFCAVYVQLRQAP
jgi:hypothetical protein